jgi:hypothetical protein
LVAPRDRSKRYVNNRLRHHTLSRELSGFGLKGECWPVVANLLVGPAEIIDFRTIPTVATVVLSWTALSNTGAPKNKHAIARQRSQAPMTSRFPMANAAGWYHTNTPLEVERVQSQ